MTAGRCLLCGRPAVEDHHITGARLDPDLSFPHCHDHHELVHDGWWTAGVGAKRSPGSQLDQDQPETFLHALYLRLRRAALWFGSLADRDVFAPIATRIAHALARWADLLQDAIDALDGSLPQWRAIPALRWQ